MKLIFAYTMLFIFCLTPFYSRAIEPEPTEEQKKALEHLRSTLPNGNYSTITKMVERRKLNMDYGYLNKEYFKDFYGDEALCREVRKGAIKFLKDGLNSFDDDQKSVIAELGGREKLDAILEKVMVDALEKHRNEIDTLINRIKKAKTAEEKRKILAELPNFLNLIPGIS